MRAVFADAFYYFALLNPDDEAHEAACQLTAGFNGSLITTEWVLTEIADGMSRPQLREPFEHLYNGLLRDPQVVIEPASHELFEQGVSLFTVRPDKEWSLTDCISFVVMRRRGLIEALTGDHHFEQAGFIALLK